jgi:Holliday junction resolvasome RuvABC endonuclease subunit
MTSQESPMLEISRTPVEIKSFVGLDLSLCSTGFCIKTGNDIRVETIKSKPDDFPNDLARLKYIVAEVVRRVPKSVSMICLEDFFVPSSSFQVGSAIKIAMLGTAIRLALYDVGMPFFVVSPNSLKKHILGKGAGKKDLIIREVYKKYGMEVKDSDQADALVLSCIAEQMSQALSGGMGDWPKYQKEVVAALLEARKERGYNL